MPIIINPGSENKGGTFKQARINARKWLTNIHDSDGFLEVVMDKGKELKDDDFEFIFTHNITKKTATLHTHGFTKKQCKEFVFAPRIYWNGSSTAEPEIKDWLADGFKFRIEYYKNGSIKKEKDDR